MSSGDVEVYKVQPLVLFVASVLALFSYLESSFSPPLASSRPNGHSFKKRTRKKPQKKKKILNFNFGSFWLLFSTKKQQDSHIGNGQESNGEKTQEIITISAQRVLKEQSNEENYRGVKVILSPKKDHIVHCFKQNFAYLKQSEPILVSTLKEEEIVAAETQPKDSRSYELEIDKYRRQAKREAELRVAAEDNLRFCEAQLQKERERVKSLEHDIFVLQSKYSSFKLQKQREESKIARTEEVMKLSEAVGSANHHREDSSGDDEKMSTDIVYLIPDGLSDEPYET